MAKHDSQPENLYDPTQNDVSLDDDMVMEHILENINNTPIGQVLKKIATLPEVRKDKVLDVRKRISQGSYDISDRLDEALDKVLEDLTA
ncbi:MAG: flagellar biosynthesis anti-sigma factor FlgM [Phycisphaerae bacterium]|nr:flagellar biosynthesis anti-sigma factor FlgM [Phycisphaerae bacterium]